jgi:glycosyltransferase involved in cell wall biosynthesis
VPQPPSSRIVLAVATRDRADQLRRSLLPSLQRAVRDGYRVVVVDQSRDSATADLLADVGVRYLRSEPGLSRARNVAVAATTEPLIAFTDDDVTFPEGWLAGIVDLFDEHEQAGGVLGTAVTPGGELMPGNAPGVYSWPRMVFQLGSGFNMAFRREALRDAGEFDVDLGAGARFPAAEDTDMFYRVLKAGWSLVCSDDIPVVHDDWRSPSEARRTQWAYGVGAGAQTAKHVIAGDRMAGRHALRAAGRHVYWALRLALTGHGSRALLPLASFGGGFAGFGKALRFMRHRASPSLPSNHPSS